MHLAADADQSNVTAQPSLAEVVLGLSMADLSATARAHVVDAITDNIGCTLAGSREQIAIKLLHILPTVVPASPQATIPLIGTARFAAPLDAALYNGTAAHALDCDDFSHPAAAHPSVVLVPALFSVLDRTRATGADVMLAYVAGLQVFGTFVRALNPYHSETGFHCTSTVGSLAAAAAVGRLLSLSSEQLTMAIGIAASSASGLRGNAGTMTKPLHAGQAARNGVMAVLLAKEGVVCNPDVITAKLGFVRSFNAGGPVDEAALRDWRTPLEIETDFGLNLKSFPSGMATHTAIEAVFALRNAHHIAAGDVDHISVGAPRRAFSMLPYGIPRSTMEAKFSMTYCVAAALLDGDVTLASFDDDRIARGDIAALLPKIAMVDDARVREHAQMGSIVRIVLKDGRVLEQQVMIASGKPEKWLTPQRLRSKFMDCAGRAMGDVDADRLYAALRQLETLPDLSQVIAGLAAVRGALV